MNAPEPRAVTEMGPPDFIAERFVIFQRVLDNLGGRTEAARVAITDAAETAESASILARGLARDLAAPDDPASDAPGGMPEYWPFASDPQDQGVRFDMAFFTSARVLCVPSRAQFVPLTENGHRFLVARNGLFLECRRSWLHLIWPVSKLTAAVALPYGEIKASATLGFGALAPADIQPFAARARGKLPNETGAWMSWEHGMNPPPRLVWDDAEDLAASPASLTYERPQDEEHYTPCIDFHSHGVLPAGFSATDDADDAGEVKIAIVLGNLDQPVPSIAARLCCLGLTIPLGVDAVKVFG